MRSIMFALLLVCSATAVHAQTVVRRPWYVTHPHSVTTLNQALAEERSFLGANNPYWRGHAAAADTCAALADVGLTCDYNTRVELSMFLTVNGKGLFPVSGHTNPYCDGGLPSEFPDDCFIGHGRQNAMLAAAVRRNAALFHHGDLSAADVRQYWQ